MRRSMSIFGVDEPGILDVQEGENEPLAGDISQDDSITLMDDLDYLVGAVEEDDEGSTTPTNNKIVASSEFRLDELPGDMKDILSHADPQDLERGLVVRDQGANGMTPRNVKRIVRRTGKGGQGGTAIYEITTETTEVVEEITTTTLKQQASPKVKNEGSKMKRLPNPFGGFRQERERLAPAPEEDWFAVDAASNSNGTSKGAIPEMPNGRAAASYIASNSRKEAMVHPEESRQRVQEVVRTITKRLIQRKRVVRQVEVHNVDSDEEMADGTLVNNQSPQKRKGTETPKSALEDETSTSRWDTHLGSSLQKALGKTKASPMSIASPRQMLSPYDGNVATPSRLPVRHKEKDLPMTPSLVESMSARRKRRSRAASIGSIRSFASHSHTHVQSTTTTKENDGNHDEGPNGIPGSFPRQHLVKNLRRFMRHSSAAYGQNFMRVLGIGDMQYLFADTRERSANIFSYAHHVGIPPEAVLLSSYCEGASLPFHSEKMAPIVNYISRDDASKAIVLTCRGTLGLSDILTDLTCTFVDVDVEDGNPMHRYQVHSGMLASAQRLSTPGNTVLETLKTALEANPEYGLVLTGHSLGGGVACLLAMQLSSPAHSFQASMMQEKEKASAIRHPKITTPFVTGLRSGLPPGRPIHAFAYGPPAVASPDLSRYCKGLCTSAVHAFDIVPTLSLGTLHDLKAVACSLSDERESIMAQEIVGRVVGLYKKKKQQAKDAIAGDTNRPMLSSDGHNDDSDGEILRPTELPPHERNLHLDIEELALGRTKNRANEADYKDPHYSEPSSSSFKIDHDSKEEEDQDVQDWLWSLIKTMRAGMDNDKLYPPGTVYLLEMQQVHVTAQMSASQQDMFMKNGKKSKGNGISSNRAEEAARVIVRLVDDVTSRFREPIFSRSMFRDHLPTNCEFCSDSRVEE